MPDNITRIPERGGHAGFFQPAENRLANAPAQAARDLARQAGEFSFQQEKKRQAREMNRARLAAAEELNKLTAELQAADPAEAPELFEERAGEIRARLTAQTPEALQEDFGLVFDEIAIGRRQRVRSDATVRLRAQGVAELDDAHERQLRLAAAAEDEEDAAVYLGLYEESVDEAVAAGTIDARQAQARKQSFREAFTEVKVMQGIRANPQGMMAALADPDFRPDLDPAKRERFIQAAESEWRQQLEMEARLDRLAEKERERAEERTALEGDRLLISGELDRQWLEENAGRLSTSDRRHFLRAITGGDAQGDPGTYADLLIRAGEGENVTPQARRLFAEGQLSLGHFEKIVARAEKTEDEQFRRGERFLRNFLGISEFTGTAIARQRYADAIEEWRQWLDGHPDADDAAMEKAFRRIGRERSFGLDFASPDGASLPSLQDIDRMEDDLAKRVEAGEISPQEATKEAERIRNLRREVQRQQGAER